MRGSATAVLVERNGSDILVEGLSVRALVAEPCDDELSSMVRFAAAVESSMNSRLVLVGEVFLVGEE